MEGGVDKMRLWHTKLIPVLPREHLVAQWRELSSIAGKIQLNGNPNHVLVNFVMDYDLSMFCIVTIISILSVGCSIWLFGFNAHERMIYSEKIRLYIKNRIQ
jgi:hypothetical protein